MNMQIFLFTSVTARNKMPLTSLKKHSQCMYAGGFSFHAELLDWDLLPG